MLIYPDYRKVEGKSGKVAEINRIVGNKYRIDMEGETVDTMIVGFDKAFKIAKELVK